MIRISKIIRDASSPKNPRSFIEQNECMWGQTPCMIRSYLFWLLPVDAPIAAVAGAGEREGELAAPDPARPPGLAPRHGRRLLVARVLLAVVDLHRA